MTTFDLGPASPPGLLDPASRPVDIDLTALERPVAASAPATPALVPSQAPAPGAEVTPVTVAPTVSLVIPTLNEARNLRHLALRLPAGLHQLVIVDGNSTDGSAAVARELWPHALVTQQTRRGKGNALACGFAACTGDIIVMIDADGSTDPHEMSHFVDALQAGADLVKGSRFLAWGGSADITALRGAGNRVLSELVNRVFRTEFTDLCYGYNAFWRSSLAALELEPGEPGPHQWGDGFEIETLIALRGVRAGLRIGEVPSFERSRQHGVSNLRAVSDGLRVLRTIWREWARPVHRAP